MDNLKLVTKKDNEKTTFKVGDVEIGKVMANDGKQWVWGYVNGEPQFIRIVDEQSQTRDSKIKLRKGKNEKEKTQKTEEKNKQ